MVCRSLPHESRPSAQRGRCRGRAPEELCGDACSARVPAPTWGLHATSFASRSKLVPRRECYCLPDGLRVGSMHEGEIVQNLRLGSDHRGGNGDDDARSIVGDREFYIVKVAAATSGGISLAEAIGSRQPGRTRTSTSTVVQCSIQTPATSAPISWSGSIASAAISSCTSWRSCRISVGGTLDLSSSSAARTSPVVISVGHATPAMPAPRSTGVPRGRVAPALPRSPRGGELGPRRRALRAA
jgi:hypothetical protein